MTLLNDHRLPLRLEIQLAIGVIPFAVIVDADHRDVAFTGKTFDDMLDYVEVANAPLPSSIADRLSIMSPCNRMPWRLATAFECLANGVFTDWITPEIREELGREICWLDAAGNPHATHVRRWHDWRAAEDAALEKAGIRPRGPMLMVR